MWTKVTNLETHKCLAEDATRLRMSRHSRAEVLETLRRAPASLQEIAFVEMALDADMMRELERFTALTYMRVSDCAGTILPLPPSLAEISVNGGEVAAFLPALARSDIESLWLKQLYGMDHALIAATIETSKLKFVKLCVYTPLTERDVARYVSAAEKSDVEIIFFTNTETFNVDLRRTRKLTDFGNSLNDQNNHNRYLTYQYTPHLNAAMDVRLVLVVLSARSGPAAKFLKRDGDHACMARVLKYM